MLLLVEKFIKLKEILESSYNEGFQKDMDLDDISSLMDVLHEAEKALEYYADRKTYDAILFHNEYNYYYAPIHDDKGNRASFTLGKWNR